MAVIPACPSSHRCWKYAGKSWIANKDKLKFPYPLHSLMQGVFFMCRKNKLLGSVLIGFGVGLLLGTVIGSGFWCCCLALGACVLGVVVIKLV